MEIEQQFADLLGLGQEWRMASVQFDEADTEVSVAGGGDGGPLAGGKPAAGWPRPLHDHVPPLSWRHLNVFNCESVIECRLPRGERADGSVYRVTPPWRARTNISPRNSRRSRWR